MFVLARALTYAVLFISLVLFVIPASLLSNAGIDRPPKIGPAQIVGSIAAVCGLGIALWCVVTFALVGYGTPALFDPPRRLVVRGPYRFVRNPMYLGAGLALAGVALFYRSLSLLGYLVFLAVVIQLLVVYYEEPTLRRVFGEGYEAYRRRVRRWWPSSTRDPGNSEIPVFGARIAGQTYVPRPSAYALLQDSAGRVAVVETPRGFFLPGGGLEGHETAEEAVVRETQEECGLPIRAGACIGRAVQLVHSPAEAAHFEKISVFLECTPEELPSGPEKEEDHDLIWISADEAARRLTHESHRWAVARWKSCG
jgi:protein-S-isoprenylcysteine O-methyltransferase Ste14/8-oxo-dGTP pyrophosphatase MutT (NUDIX family)